MCAFCGSATITGEKKKEDRYFCDHECRSQFKKTYYRSQEWQHKTGIKQRQEAAVAKKKSLHIGIRCCSWCGRAGKWLKKFCNTKECIKERRREESRVLHAMTYKKESWECVCIECSKKYTPTMHASRSRYCSKRCQRKHIKRNRDHMKRSNGYVQRIGTVTLAKKHKWKCADCGCKCVRANGSNADNEATLDHIMPLSKGGLHVWANVQLLCRKCNTSKNDHVHIGTQLLLLLK